MSASISIGGTIKSITLTKVDGRNVINIMFSYDPTKDFSADETTVGFCLPTGKTIAIVDEVPK